jgi:branched-chain amino acid transport system substrate-binding protein
MISRLALAALAAGLMAGGAQAQANAQTAVKLGILNDMAGPYADISGPGSVVAARLAVEDFKPDAHGLKVEIVASDHQNKPDVGSAIARQWYDQDGVDAIFDVTTSSVALAVSQVTKEKNKIFLISGGGTSDLTGTACTPNNVHWTYDTWALAHGTGAALTKRGENSWYFLTADYAFGTALQRDTTAAVEEAGGKVLGATKHPLNNADFSSALLQAQSSKAKVVGLANAGTDTTNAIKQAAEFGLVEGGQALAGLLVFSSDVKALGLKAAQGLVLTEGFYWDLNDKTRAFSKRFAEKFGGKMPTSSQAGVYSSTLAYLNAVAAAKSKDTAAIMAKLRAAPIDDPLFGPSVLRADGRVTHAMYLFEVKKPAESKGEWDLYKTLATIAPEEAFRPLGQGGCPLVAKN